jgi:hypothetical protein
VIGQDAGRTKTVAAARTEDPERFWTPAGYSGVQNDIKQKRLRAEHANGLGELGFRRGPEYRDRSGFDLVDPARRGVSAQPQL